MRTIERRRLRNLLFVVWFPKDRVRSAVGHKLWTRRQKCGIDFRARPVGGNRELQSRCEIEPGDVAIAVKGISLRGSDRAAGIASIYRYKRQPFAPRAVWARNGCPAAKA